jgi:glycosyltransferase involved in cell wall biosynthesis
MSRVGVVLARMPAAEPPSTVCGRDAPETEFHAIINQNAARVLHSGLAPSWSRGGAQTLASLAAFVQRREFDAFYVTSEDMGLLAGLLLRAAGWRGRLVVVVHAVTSAKRKAAMKLVGRRVISNIICVSETQRQTLIDETGFPADRVHLMANWVDTDFFTPGVAKGDYVFSCGLESRDYSTLLSAASRVEVPFIVAASGFFGRDAGLEDNASANVTVLKERVPWTKLRDLYAQSRFVVLPLHAVDYAAGVTGLLEAWAAGKPVIATASPGIAEYLVDGESGLVVPPNNSGAMAQAIETLWNDPERCEAIGRRNRAWVEQNASVTDYARAVTGLLRGNIG